MRADRFFQFLRTKTELLGYFGSVFGYDRTNRSPTKMKKIPKINHQIDIRSTKINSLMALLLIWRLQHVDLVELGGAPRGGCGVTIMHASS
jgi:hypothetical protein